MEIEGNDKQLQTIQSMDSFKKTVMQISQVTTQNCKYFAEIYFKSLADSQPLQYGVIKDLLDHFKYNKTVTKSHLCGKILQKGVLAFRCTQCMLEDNSIICVQCFNNGKHNGHHFQKIQVFGGCCDCGDQEKWQADGFCTDHQPIDHNIQVDKLQQKKFIPQMKFLCYVICCSYHLFETASDQYRQGELLATTLAEKLKQFNQNSIVSGQLTFNLLLSPFHQDYKNIISYSDKQFIFQGERVLEVLFSMKNFKKFNKVFVDLLTIMFAVPDFRAYLTQRFSNYLIKNPMIIQSEIINVTCQIYTSHKLIKNLVKQNRFPSLNILNLPSETKFESIASIYYRFFIDLSYLARLYNGVNTMVMKNQFTKGSVCDICNFQVLSLKDRQQSIDYYGIQYIFFSYFYQILHSLKDDKKTLLKMIKDLFENISEQKCNFVYQTKQRAFILCLVLYYDGDFSQACQNEAFLDSIGFNPQKDMKKLTILLSTTTYMMKTYALTLSNRQFGHRYFTFFSFSFFKIDYLIAFDMLFLKFCLQLYKNYGSVSLLNHYIKKPVQDAIQIFQKQFTTHHQEVYDRTKVLGILGDYIGLLIQALISDYPLITAKSALKILKEDEAHQFYGNILASLKSIQILELKKICITIVGEQLAYFEEFIQKYAQWSGRNVQLKQSNNFPGLNLGYIKSKKINRFLQKYLMGNLEKFSISTVPPSISSQSNKLIAFAFNDQFVQKIFQVGSQYLDIIKLDQSILQTDFGAFSKYIEQLMYLNQMIKDQKITILLNKICKTDSVMKICNSYIKKKLKQFENCEKTDKFDNNMQMQDQKQTIAKQKLKERKISKLQKFKKKKQKAMNLFFSAETIAEQEVTKEEGFCVFCKHSTKFSLGVLCFIQKSNLPMQKLLNSSRDVYIITSCNHLIHQKCYNQLYGAKQYAFCSICKTSCNLLLIDPIKQMQSHIEQKQQIPEQEAINSDILPTQRIQISIAMVDANIQAEKAKIQMQQEGQQQLQTLGQKILESLIISVLRCLQIDSAYFLRSQISSCHYLLNILKNEKNMNLDKFRQIADKQSKNENQKTHNWNLYKYIGSKIISICELGLSINQWNLSNLKIEQKQAIKIDEIIQSIIKFETNHHQPELSFIAKQSLNLHYLPENLQTLAKNVGQCKHCHRTTNQISLCLLCDFVSCKSCQVADLTLHTFNTHSGACVFIQVDSGKPIYIGGKKSGCFDSIYDNILKEPYISGGKKDRTKYKLNMNKLQNIEKDIRSYKIEQKIRYQELITFKSNTKRW